MKDGDMQNGSTGFKSVLITISDTCTSVFQTKATFLKHSDR